MPNNDSIHVAKFKAKAKALLKAVKTGNPEALRIVQPYFDNPGELKLTQAQLVVARKHECNSWKELVSKDNWLACPFCGKWQYEVKKLIAGPGVNICNECVEICNGVMREELPKQEDPMQFV